VATLWVDRMSREVHEPSDGAPDDLLECRELAAAAARAVAELPEQRRRIFVLCREHDMSYAEVGERLGISPRTVNTQMTRALKTLRAKLAPYFPCT
jgi:RNA polymerase sigma-70 factor (ECF subfamily)